MFVLLACHRKKVEKTSVGQKMTVEDNENKTEKPAAGKVVKEGPGKSEIISAAIKIRCFKKAGKGDLTAYRESVFAGLGLTPQQYVAQVKRYSVDPGFVNALNAGTANCAVPLKRLKP